MTTENGDRLRGEPTASIGPSPGQIWRFDATSPDDAERLAHPLEAQYVQLGRGRFREQAQGVFLDSVLIASSRLDTSIRFRGAVLPDSLAFQSFHSVAPLIKGHVPLCPDFLVISKACDPLDLTTQAAARALTVFVYEQQWCEFLQILGAEWVAELPTWLAAVQCSTVGLERFRHRVRWVLQAADLYTTCFQRREIRRSAEIGLICSVIELLQSREQQIEYPRSATRRHVAVVEVEAYIRDHLHESLTLVDLCRIGRLEVRALQYAFQEKFGVSPMAYLKLTRLDRARRLLLTADRRTTNVTSIALQIGFWHLSQFAQDYRTMFGESPSETLRRTSPAS